MYGGFTRSVSGFHACLQVFLQLVLEQLLQAITHGVWIAAAELETRSLHGGDIRIDRLEFLRNILVRLAQFRPGMHQRGAVDAFEDDLKPLAQRRGRSAGGPRLLAGIDRGRFHGQAEVEAGFAVLRAIAAP